MRSRIIGLGLGILAAAALTARASAQVPASLFQELHWRFVGPYRAGWATVTAGVPGQPDTYYFGAAGGGVWKTTDAGRTWQGLFQHEGSASIGALAVAPSNPKILYVGTGQVAARYDILAGDGVYRSDDGGETWRNVGLKQTRHIGAILIDPHDPNRVLVAALGHVFDDNAERGVYLTADGGATWQHVLTIDAHTGVVDLAWDPERPRVVYAAAWQMRIHPWLDYFQPQAGPGSGIYKSNDEGVHWKHLHGNGLPAGNMGRIGLAVARGSGGRVVYASIATEGSPLTSARLARSASGLYRSGDGGDHWKLVNNDPALASSYFGRVTVAPDDSNTVYVMGQSIRRSTDGGRTIEIVKGAPGGDDYHFLWIDPQAPDHMITGADQGAAVTVNGGASWSSWYNQPTGQFYHVAADDRFPYRMYSGQQDNGTVEIASRGPYGVIELRDWHPVGGDERDYMVPKPGAPDTVFGSGLGGHLSRFDEVTRQVAEVSPWPVPTYGARPTTVRYRYTWITPLEFSPIPPHPLYFGAQVLFRSRDDGVHWDTVSPDLTGWKQGATGCEDPGLQAASACGFGVIYTIAPSPVDSSTIWVGTDDGRIQLTTDGGGHWRDVTPSSVTLWARIDAISPFARDSRIAYAAVDMHRTGNFAPLILRTLDRGRSWTPIVTGLPADQYVFVVRADPVRRGLLYAGTNRGVYVSFDDGGHWQPLSLNLPTTPIRDLLVHGADLIAATQGRGIWVLDDLEPLREVDATLTAAPAHLFQPGDAWRIRADENRDTPWPPSTALGENPPPGAVIDYSLGQQTTGTVAITIKDADGNVVRQFSSLDSTTTLPANRYFQKQWLAAPQHIATAPGMHRLVWDLRYARPPAFSYDYSIAAVWGRGTPLTPEGPLVVPGRYSVTLSAGGRQDTKPLTVRLDPRVHVAAADLAAQLQLAQAVDSTLTQAVAADQTIAQTLAGNNISPAERDSLGAIRGDIHQAAGVLAGLVTAIEGADAAPTQGQQAVFDAYRQRLDDALARGRKLKLPM